MADAIDFSTGKAGFVTYQEPAWHGFGKVSLTRPTVEECKTDGGLGFTVLKKPNEHTLGNGQRIISTTSFFTERTDNNIVLGDRLGKIYTVYQNDEALAMVDELVKTGKAEIETAGSLYEGRKIFICLKLKKGIKVAGKDEIFQYVLLANGHDGSLSICALLTNVRVVCANTLSAALSGAKAEYKIRHTATADQRLKEALTMLGVFEKTSKANEAAYNAMKHQALTPEAFFNYIGNIFIEKEDITQLRKGNDDVLSSVTKNVLHDVIQFAEIGIGQREAMDNGLNMWGAMNAVTGYLTSKSYGSKDDRFDSLIFGDSARKIKMAGELAIKPHLIQPVKMDSSAGLSLN